MLTLHRWNEWTWEEIFTSLSRERGQGEAFVIPCEQVRHPLSCGANRNPGLDEEWDYRFGVDDGSCMYVKELGARYMAFLEPVEAERFDPCAWQDVPAFDSHLNLMAIAGGLLVLLGGMWALLETAVTGLG